MNLKKSLFAITLIVVMITSVFSPTAAASRDGSRFVRLPVGELTRFAALGLAPRLNLDYGSFRWLELSAADFARLSASGIAFTEEREAGQVRVWNYHFDPLNEGEPNLPKELRTSAETFGSEGFRLIQLRGPARDEWLNQLRASGLTILQYYPHHTFLVWATAGQSETVKRFDFVRWQGYFHSAYRLSPTLAVARGQIENVAVTYYNDGNLKGSLDAIQSLGGKFLQHFAAQPDGRFYTAIITLNATALNALSNLRTVWSIEYSAPRPAFDDENGAQIIAGNISGGLPFPGYYDFLAEKGVDGSGVTWADVDTGLNSTHPDLTGRAVAFVSYTGAGQANQDPDGHGSHTAGAIMGDGKFGTAITDPSGFYWGTGAAPEANLVVQNALMGTSWPPAGGWQILSRDSVVNGAIGSSNSWYTGASGSQGYSIHARTHDLMVRDANWDTSTIAEPIIMVFSAGNGGPSPITITEPKEAKNLITVAAAHNYPRSGGSVNDMAYYSSRGPSQDGRLLPNVAAPGDQTSSLNGTGTAKCGSAVPGSGSAYYNFCSGTSMAAPFVAGSAALIADWWQQEGWGTPSPALVKAMLINGASDMVGGSGIPGTLPNNTEGWGRVNLDNVIRNGVSMIYRDQLDILSDSGNSWTMALGVPDLTKPFKVSLVWADAPGAAGANPALVNNLDLTVTNGGITYLGNVFSNGWSVPGGSADALNNIENVFVQTPAADALITISAVNIAGDGIPYNSDLTDQDFALVCYNCILEPDFTLTATPTSRDICATQTASYSVTVGQVLGYNQAVTLTASGQPAGTKPRFTPKVVTPPGTSNLKIRTTTTTLAGNYLVTIKGTSVDKEHTINVGLNLFTAKPGAVTLLSPTNGASDVDLMPTFEWSAATQGSTYILQVATDVGFTNIIYSVSQSGTSNTMTTALTPETIYYWRVRPRNSCGAGSYSAPFSFTTRAIPPLLLVDDDDNAPDVRAYYTEVLDALGFGYDIWDTGNSDNEPDATTLAPYRAVVWFSGDEYGGFAGPGPDGETALGTYLDGGGNLFISGQDYFYDRGLTTFMSTYLGVASATSDVNQTTVAGRGSVYTGLGPYTLAYPFSDYSDKVVARSGAEQAFIGNKGSAAVDKTNGSYHTTFLGYPLEAIPNLTDREAVLNAFLNWCGITP